MKIREARNEDWDALWPIFQEIVKAGETHAYEVESTQEQAKKIWLDDFRKTFVFETAGRLPKAFNHPTKGYVDALVMFKLLQT